MISCITNTLQPNPIDMVFYGSDMGLQTNLRRGGTSPNFKRSKKFRFEMVSIQIFESQQIRFEFFV